LEAFFVSALVVALGEIGDKTQSATVALAARFDSLVALVCGTTAGMLLADVPAVLVGGKASLKLPLRAIRYVAAVLFAAIRIAAGWPAAQMSTVARIAALLARGGVILFVPHAWGIEPIDTDGPDFVESSEVVPKGHFQYEIDFTSVGSEFSTPALLKYGAANNIELRVAPEGYVRKDGRSGRGDTAFGLKWHSQDRDPSRGVPAVSWIAHFAPPSGTDGFRGNGVRPSVRSVITWQLPRDLALGLMPGLKYDAREDGRRFTLAILGIVLNKRLGDRLRTFVEFSVPQVAPARDGGVLASWDVGAAYLLSNDAQLGIRTGVAANRNTPRNYLLIEIAQRL
jgi:hypothetical protein